MKRCILLGACFILLMAGCSTTAERDKLIEKGTFLEKVAYLEDNYGTKDDVLEFLGPPDAVKSFNDYSAIWSYKEEGEKPVDFLFGRGGTILRIEFKPQSDY